MWLRVGAVVALSIGVLAVAAPTAAFAQDPVDLQGAYVYDGVGAITGDEARVQAAVDDLYDRAHIQLFVVYVDSFTGAADNDWATQTATRNGLGQSDILLAIATEDRNYQVSVDNEFGLTETQLTEVDNDYLIPQLRDNNWADAAIDAAKGYAAAATGVVGPGTPSSPGTGSPAATGGISPVFPIVGGVVVVGAGVFIYSRVRKRRTGEAVAVDPGQLTQKQLDQRAGTLLVQLDDSLKTSEQELGFAVAQFGDSATTEFTAVLASAKAKVAQAFTLRQQLDDSQPESDADKRALTTQIIQLCEAADTELDAQADSFDELRKLESNAPDALAAARASLAEVTTRRAATATALTALTGRYSTAAARPVADNIAQADKLLKFAAGSADAAEKAIAAGKPADAAIAVRSAQQAAGQAAQLFDAVDKLGADLAEASSKLDAAIADTSQDIAAAKALAPDPALSASIAAAASALASAQAAGADPITSFTEIGKANAALESVFTNTRDKQEQLQRATSQLGAAIAAARAQVSSATEYITTRRGGIGDSARTRVSAAQRHLDQAVALAASDPVTALQEAQQANAMASTALDFAQGDVQTYSQESSSFDSAGDNDDGSDGADLGGLWGYLFGGGGGGGSRSSGSSYRSSGSWGGGSSRSSRSGSFGGSSRSSFRSSGGRSSHGGRF